MSKWLQVYHVKECPTILREFNMMCQTKKGNAPIENSWMALFGRCSPVRVPSWRMAMSAYTSHVESTMIKKNILLIAKVRTKEQHKQIYNIIQSDIRISWNANITNHFQLLCHIEKNGVLVSESRVPATKNSIPVDIFGPQRRTALWSTLIAWSHESFSNLKKDEKGFLFVVVWWWCVHVHSCRRIS